MPRCASIARAAKERMLELLTDEQEAKYLELMGQRSTASSDSTNPHSSRRSLRNDRLVKVCNLAKATGIAFRCTQVRSDGADASADSVLD